MKNLLIPAIVILLTGCAPSFNPQPASLSTTYDTTHIPHVQGTIYPVSAVTLNT